MNTSISRRNFMVRTITGIFAFIGGVLAVALGGFGIVPALKKNEPEWSDAGTIDDLIVDEPQERRFVALVKSGWQLEKKERSLWLVRKSDGTVVAFSSGCPHLGCGYRWISAHRRFECPCHASMFDLTGRVMAGPAPRSLDTLTTRVENNRLFVQYAVFQLGISKKTLM
jgi:menaquinol-cytochrome c reductase iron-sulfur subunit